jgi:hypothetical protein
MQIERIDFAGRTEDSAAAGTSHARTTPRKSLGKTPPFCDNDADATMRCFRRAIVDDR